MKLYDERIPEELGEHYIRHVSAMTGEKLHNKSDIAAELAFRDCVIATKDATITALGQELARLQVQGKRSEIFENILKGVIYEAGSISIETFPGQAIKHLQIVAEGETLPALLQKLDAGEGTQDTTIKLQLQENAESALWGEITNQESEGAAND